MSTFAWSTQGYRCKSRRKSYNMSTLVTSLDQLHTLHVSEREGILDCLRLGGGVFNMVLFYELNL